MKLNIDANLKKKVLMLFVIAGVLLICSHVAMLFMKYHLGINHKFLYPLVDMDVEANLPTYYSVMAFLSCSLLLFIIGKLSRVTGHKLHKMYWYGLSLVFLFLSGDEMVSFHEALSYQVKGLLNFGGMPYFAWIIPYSLIVLILGVLYIKFFFSLPKKIIILFLISAGVFLSGALGFEFAGGFIYEQMLNTAPDANIRFYYALMTTGEEVLETAGQVLFIYSLFTYIIMEFKKFTMTVEIGD